MAVSAGILQFGRSARVIVDDILVADIKNGDVEKSLAVNFDIVKNVSLEPNTTTVQVINLSQFNRDKLTRRIDEAKKLSFDKRSEIKAGTLKVSAGYEIPELISQTNILDIKHEKNGSTWVTTIKAQDGRLAWSNAFVKETLDAGGADLSTVKSVLNAVAKIQEGVESEQAFQQALPEYQVSKGTIGFRNGYVMFGPVREKYRDIFDALGINVWISDGRLVAAPRDLPLPGVAVVAQEGKGLLRAVKEEDRNYTITTLLNPKLEPGRQVHLLDKKGKPIGVGVYRVNHSQWIGATMENEWVTTAELRPTALGGIG